jgi:hypothetical protein
MGGYRKISSKNYGVFFLNFEFFPWAIIFSRQKEVENDLVDFRFYHGD